VGQTSVPACGKRKLRKPSDAGRPLILIPIGHRVGCNVLRELFSLGCWLQYGKDDHGEEGYGKKGFDPCRSRVVISEKWL
jgi:hypothetical protein